MSENKAPQAVQAPPQEVNVDELEVHILMVVKNPAQHQSCAQFLSRRGWPTEIVSNLGKAVQHIVSKKPDMVLFSLNHPNPSISRLPLLLSQGFNTTCVGFIEHMDAKSQAFLANSKLANKIQGLPSGPNVHRGIRKILMEIYNPQPTAPPVEKQDHRESVGGGPSYIPNSEGGGHRKRLSEVSGASGRTGPAYIPQGDQGSQGPSAADLLRILGEQDSSSDTEGSSSGKESNIGYMPQPSDSAADPSHVNFSRAHKPHSPWVPMDVNSKNSGTATGTETSGVANVSGSNEPGTGVRPPDPSSYQRGTERQGLPPPPTVQQQGTQGHQLTQPGAENTAENHSELENTSAGDKPRLNLMEQQARNSSLPSAPMGFPSGAPRFATPSIPQVSSEQFKTSNAGGPSPSVRDAVKEALSSIIAKSDDPCLQGGVTDRLGVYLVKSSQYIGYVALGFGHSDNVENVVLQFQDQLENLLSQKEPGIEVEIGFEMALEDVDFNEWLEREADYSLCLTLSQKSICAGVFAFGDFCYLPQADVENSEMHSIKVESLTAEEKMEFDAFLHLKKNGKYLKYLKKGGVVEEKQIHRLASSNAQLRISSRHLSEFKKHVVRQDIKRRVQPFLEKAA